MRDVSHEKQPGGRTGEGADSGVGARREDYREAWSKAWATCVYMRSPLSAAGRGTPKVCVRPCLRPMGRVLGGLAPFLVSPGPPIRQPYQFNPVRTHARWE